MEKSLREILAENVKFYRKKRGFEKITQIEKESGLSHNTIRYIENGERSTTIDAVERLAKLFDVDPYFLLMPVKTRPIHKVKPEPKPQPKTNTNKYSEKKKEYKSVFNVEKGHWERVEA